MSNWKQEAGREGWFSRKKKKTKVFSVQMKVCKLSRFCSQNKLGLDQQSTGFAFLTVKTAWGYSVIISHWKDFIVWSSLLWKPFSVTVSPGWTTRSKPALASGGVSTFAEVKWHLRDTKQFCIKDIRMHIRPKQKGASGISWHDWTCKWKVSSVNFLTCPEWQLQHI